MASKGKKIAVTPRARTKMRLRRRITGDAERPRVTVFKSSKHIYAQAINDIASQTLVSASTLEKEVIDQIAALSTEGVSHSSTRSSKSVLAAHAVGLILAKRTLALKIDEVIFDRNGFIYKGRVRAVADGARKGGLKF